MVFGPLLAAAGFAVIGEGLQARGGPFSTVPSAARSISPGNILRVALARQALSERGLVPVTSTDPFTGNLVISTEDQSEGLFNLLGERFAREALASTPEESAEIFRQREAFIESRRQFPVFPGGAAPAVPDVREQVVLALSRESPQRIAPGVVSSRLPNVLSRRLGGPCAGVTTGFQRLNCARGGIS